VPLPYLQAEELHVGGVSIHPFGILVASGVLVTSLRIVRRAAQRGLARSKIESFSSYILVSSFFFSHVFDVLMYRPADALKNPLELLMVWHGISSYGGFLGCLIGAWVWSRVKKEPLFPYGDQAAAVFPVGWMFGRTGCAIAHDHVGRLSDSPLAVAFPPGLYDPPGARFDLGLLELLATIPIAIVIGVYAHKPRRAGSITGLLCVLYAPVRFPLDALRATDIAGADARYAGMTPAQWLSIALFLAGAWLLRRAKTQPIVGREATPRPPPVVAAPPSVGAPGAGPPSAGAVSSTAKPSEPGSA
jgi:phosphatidylglycerol:prolipoprotein diacylglycerol transferase